MRKQHTIQELLAISTQYLSEKGCASPRLDAELLLGHVLGMSRLDLYLNLQKPLTTQEVDEYRQCIGRRGRRVPVAYITGTKEFYSLDFKVTPAVLIPRPETELLVEEVVRAAHSRLTAGKRPVRILDLGTGSGAVAIAVARQDPDFLVTAVDISPDALIIARENAESLEVVEQVEFIESDLFSKVRGSFDVICSNPPYVTEDEMRQLQPEVAFEPAQALHGGVDGLDYYRRIFHEAPGFLERPGAVMVEIGADQGQAVSTIAQQAGFEVEKVVVDYQGHDRVVVAVWR